MPNCGGTNQPPCKPVPTSATQQYTPEEMDKYGHECYQKGRVDERMVPHPGDK